MAAPAVQSLEQILAELEPGYQGVRSVYQGQQAGLGAKYDAQRAGVEGKRTQGFQDIARGANSRGVDFWGVPIEEQSQYLSDVYLPGMQQANSQQNEENTQLNLALAQLEQQKLQRGQETRQGQQSAFQQWQQEQERRRWEAEQAALERAARAREAAADRAASNPAPGMPLGQSLNTIFAENWAGSKGKASRQEQDNWVRQFFADNGIYDPTVQNQLWTQVNREFKRTSNASKDRMWKKKGK